MRHVEASSSLGASGGRQTRTTSAAPTHKVCIERDQKKHIRERANLEKERDIALKCGIKVETLSHGPDNPWRCENIVPFHQQETRFEAQTPGQTTRCTFQRVYGAGSRGTLP